MRRLFLLCVVAVLLELRGNIVSKIISYWVPPDILEELVALHKSDYVGYVTLHGLNLSIYQCVTPDGWVLDLWRVRSPKIFDENLSAPVIVIHGFSGSSLTSVMDRRNESSGFVLADNGYDVWLMNCRGNMFADKILSEGKLRSPDAEDYYRAGWQHCAEIDVPTAIEKVLDETKQSKFYLLGLSMGGTIGFAFLSQNHSYDEKLPFYSAAVPALKFGEDTEFSIRTLAAYVPPLLRIIQVETSVLNVPLELIFKLLHGRSYMATQGDAFANFLGLFFSSFCFVIPQVCGGWFYLLTDKAFATPWPFSNLNKSRMCIYVRGLSGVTLMNLYEFGEQWGKESWTRTDFDKLPLSKLTNQNQYNASEPPVYDFKAIGVPYSMLLTKNDPILGSETAKKLVNELEATDYEIVDENGVTHFGAIVGPYSRCYHLNGFLRKLEAFEIERDEEHGAYRKKVQTFLGSLPFENGCLSVRK